MTRRGCWRIIREVRPRVSEFIAYKPEEALEILSSDLETTLGPGVGVGAGAGTSGSAHILDFLL